MFSGIVSVPANSDRKQMNIWILNHYAVVPDMSGGTRHYDFAKELSNRGYKVTVFASSFSHEKKAETRLFQKQKYGIENVDGIVFVWVRTFRYKKNDWRRLVNMVDFMVKLYCLGRRIVTISTAIRKPDIIIGCTVHPLTALSAYFLAKFYRSKFILEIGDLLPQSAIDIGLLAEKSLTAKALRLLEKYLCSRAKQIIVLSLATKDYLTLLGIDSHKVWVIPNGVDISRFEIPDAPDKNDKIFKVTYTGSIGLVNALMPALGAAKIIQETGLRIRFIFVGSGVEKAKLIQESKVGKLHNVEFCEPVPKHKIPSILKAADVCLLCENKILYGSSNKLMDYMASGKPVIFSTFARHNTVQEAECGLSVSPKNSESLADAIVELYNMPEEERKEMGRRGREYVEKYHSIPVLVNKLEKVIREAGNGKTVSENH